jgi:predicted phage terminase large subunit-like protein
MTAMTARQRDPLGRFFCQEVGAPDRRAVRRRRDVRAGDTRQLPSLQAVRAEIARRKAQRDRDQVTAEGEAIRVRCKTLMGFVREFWDVLEPNNAFIDNWHLHAICEHLEAVTDGRITRLLINVPPGSMKSLLVSVFWQAWEWGPCGLAHLRIVTTAFNDGPVERDAAKFLALIQSEKFQALWPVTLKRDAIKVIENTAMGDRRAVAFGSLTSQRGNRLVIDDPHSTTTAESDTDRAKTTRQFREGALNRLRDQRTDAIVVIMQRLHQDDMSGVILKLKMGFVHLMLPMEFEPERACETCIGFKDPRTVAGELLDPVRFSRETYDALKKSMTAYAVAGQYQQRPAPREGGIFKRHWFQIIDAAPADAMRVRGWDLAATETETAAFTAGVKVAEKDGIYYIEDARRDRQSPAGVERMIKNTADQDGIEVTQSIPKDPGQSGIAQAAAYAKLLAGIDARFSPESGDKEARALPVSAQAEIGNVKIVRGPWNDDYLDELCSFPSGSFKDWVDATSRAFAKLFESHGPAIQEPLRI